MRTRQAQRAMNQCSHNKAGQLAAATDMGIDHVNQCPGEALPHLKLYPLRRPPVPQHQRAVHDLMCFCEPAGERVAKEGQQRDIPQEAEGCTLEVAPLSPGLHRRRPVGHQRAERRHAQRAAGCLGGKVQEGVAVGAAQQVQESGFAGEDMVAGPQQVSILAILPCRPGRWQARVTGAAQGQWRRGVGGRTKRCQCLPQCSRSSDRPADRQRAKGLSTPVRTS